jgi:hypothetical protein
MKFSSFLGVWAVTIMFQGVQAQSIEAIAGGSGTDVIMSLHNTGDGGWISCGRWDSEVAGLEGDPWFWKWDASGNPEWSVVIPVEGDQNLYDVVPLTSGGFVAVGFTDDGGFGAPLMPYVLRLDAEGSMLASYTGSESGGFHSVAEASDGTILATGGLNSNPDSALWMKFNSNDLSLLNSGSWVVFEDHVARSMTSDGAGGWYVAGSEEDQIFVSHLNQDMEELASGSIQLSGLASVHGVQFDGSTIHVAVNDKNEFNEWRAGKVHWDADLLSAQHHLTEFPNGSSSAAPLLLSEGTGDAESLLVGYAYSAEDDLYSPFVLRHSQQSGWTGGGLMPAASGSVIVRDAMLWGDQILFSGQLLTPDSGWQGWIQSANIPTEIVEPSKPAKVHATPNPTSSLISVSLPANCPCQWLSTSGRNVTSAVRVIGVDGRFDLSDLAPGTYLAVPQCPEISSVLVVKTP